MTVCKVAAEQCLPWQSMSPTIQSGKDLSVSLAAMTPNAMHLLLPDGMGDDAYAMTVVALSDVIEPQQGLAIY